MKQIRVELTIEQAIMHYAIVWFSLLFPCFVISGFIKDYINNTHSGVRSPSDLIQTGINFSLIAIVFFFIQRHKLKFLQYKINLTQENFEEAIRRTAKVENWTITTYNKQVIQAIHRPDIWMGAGEMITIMKQGNTVLINSISNPNERGWSFWGHQNRRNVVSLLDNLRDIANHVPEKNVDPEIPEKEWTLKKILTRIFMYPLCAILIMIGIYLIIEVGYKSTIPAVGCIAAGAIYLYSDLKIITKRTTSTSEWQ